MNRTLAPLASLLLLAAALLAAAGTAEASWRMDAGRFAASAHGDLSCAECHADVAGASTHPEPARVNRIATVDTAACFTCHPDVESDMATGTHAGNPVVPADLARCASCHDPHGVGAPDQIPALEPGRFAPEDTACLSCHAKPAADAAREANRLLCLSCHAAAGRGAETPLLDLAAYAATPHEGQDCLTCHPKADQSPHNAMGRVDCLSCHTRHRESAAHDAHVGVACQACHLPGATPVRNGMAVGWTLATPKGQPSAVHAMRLEDEQGCARCHHPDNGVGAAAMVLPAKGVLCMACHSGSFTATDTVSVASLAGFGVGFLLLIGLAVSAAGGLAAAGASLALPPASRLGAVAEALLLDVLCQRRLWRRSHSRWFIHALIFYPFAIRCLWGLAAWAMSHWAPGAHATLALLDKNAPLGALLFDLTGAALLTGLVMAWRRGSKADRDLPTGLPSQDRMALGLLLGVTLAGFLLEGMRMALTGATDGAAFLGAFIALPLQGAGWLEEAYGWAWYLHAALWGAVVAYLPFSKLMHVIMAPVALALKAARPGHH